jgi:uncharacterized membrane protein YraQ (UPF0718 family)
MTRSRLLLVSGLILVVVLGTVVLDNFLPLGVYVPALALPDLAQNFVTVFLGIFIEAAPFLLLGALASGLIAVFISPDDIARVMPRNRILATLVGALLGVVFPVCECGVIPVVRRLCQKGLPLSAGIAFLLGAPVLNPIVIASTYAAFGFGPVFWGRIIFTLVIAVTVGLIFSFQPGLARVMRPLSLGPVMGGLPGDGRRSLTAGAHAPSRFASLQRAVGVAADEFFDVAPYLVAGSLLATAMQTFVPQQALLGVGSGMVLSVVALQALAFVLSVCSTVDAFLALNFVNTFTSGSIIAFLVFGPMIDIKSTLMLLGVFKRRVVVYLILLTAAMAFVVGVFVNLNLAW